jgi:hypothetical protein
MIKQIIPPIKRSGLFILKRFRVCRQTNLRALCPVSSNACALLNISCLWQFFISFASLMIDEQGKIVATALFTHDLRTK